MRHQGMLPTDVRNTKLRYPRCMYPLLLDMTSLCIVLLGPLNIVDMKGAHRSLSLDSVRIHSRAKAKC